jgi:hypothetical protein
MYSRDCTEGQIYKIIKKWLDNNPAKLHFRADVIIYSALLDPFPCQFKTVKIKRWACSVWGRDQVKSGRLSGGEATCLDPNSWPQCVRFVTLIAKERPGARIYY